MLACGEINVLKLYRFSWTFRNKQLRIHIRHLVSYRKYVAIIITKYNCIEMFLEECRMCSQITATGFVDFCTHSRVTTKLFEFPFFLSRILLFLLFSSREVVLKQFCSCVLMKIRNLIVYHNVWLILFVGISSILSRNQNTTKDQLILTIMQ